jgi:short-subunit dehydrogenase
MNVLITGASSGIGEALAQEFAKRGATLGLVARRKEMLELLAEKLPGQHYIYTADVTNKYSMRDVGTQFEVDCGGADIVIANAGISVGVLTEYFEDLDAFADTFNTNVLAIAYTFHPFIAAMRKRGRGQLIGIASVAGIRGLPGSEAYCASKAAVISYCESLRVELKKSGVQVQTILPGFIQTSMTDKNPYKMPFLMTSADFARKAVEAILKGRGYKVIPWQMGWIAKLLRFLPNAVFDKLFGNRPYKPRRGQ